jgi:hypothetical protein
LGAHKESLGDAIIAHVSPFRDVLGSAQPGHGCREVRPVIPGEIIDDAETLAEHAGLLLDGVEHGNRRKPYHVGCMQPANGREPQPPKEICTN